MKKPIYKIGDIIMIKEGSSLFYESMWVSQNYPYAKVYKVTPHKIGYEYQIGSDNIFNYEYWGTLRFVDFYEEIFHHISDNVKDHFYSNKELRKKKLEKICQNI